jgi:acetylornithine deacetylase/succinyl-diaminopimelate desuccinylase-like protein
MNQKHLDDFFSFLRFPSVSTDEDYTEQLNRCAQWLVNKVRTIGLDAEQVRTKKYPIVWGRTAHNPKKRTLLIYGHYDVQPPDPLELWDSPPFEPVLKNGYVLRAARRTTKGKFWRIFSGWRKRCEAITSYR